MHSPQYARPQEPASYATAQDQSSPKTPVPKNVAFELLLDENSKVRARIPMRVQIYPHDTTDSIVTTVKNFYGIYDNHASGVSFEDENGITLIARFENLRNNMTVYVRVIPVQAYGEGYSERFYGTSAAASASYPLDARSKRPSLGEPFQMPSLPAAQEPEQAHPPPSRPTSRVTNNKRSASPSARSRRSASHKAGTKSRGPNSTAVHDEDHDVYSDSEDDYGSNCSRKTKNELFASSDISMENILHDGRRKRPKFESSELPLFVPPQVPVATSTSSISPQRQSIVQEGAGSPFARPTHRPYAYQPLPSPQSYGHSEHAYGTSSSRNTAYATPMVPENGQRSRDRTTTQSSGGQFSNPAGQPTTGPGVLPTPDPTIASCISDEDVAMQLIRLGDASNFSHGRTSASTLDDAFSGAADAASSTGATSDGEDFSEDEDDLPARSRQRLDSSPMLPPGTTKRTHKRLDDILPSFDSSDASDDEYHHGEPTESMVKNELDDDTTYKEMAPKAKKIKSSRATSTVSNNTVKSRSNPNSNNKLPSARPGKTTTTSHSHSHSHSNTTTNNKSSSIGANSRKIKPSSSSSSVNGATSQKPMAPAAHAPTTTAMPGDGMVSPAPTRKTSMSSVTNGTTNLQSQLAADEEDLSTKPRCQRCRKSKKGCDRQRPCGRCKDAGIGIEGCISEDEGNGRKGRYGRHMGVPVKKTSLDFTTSPVEALPVASFASADKNKKRKR